MTVYCNENSLTSLLQNGVTYYSLGALQVAVTMPPWLTVNPPVPAEGPFTSRPAHPGIPIIQGIPVTLP